MPPKTKSEKRRLTPEALRERLMLRVQEYADLTGTPQATVYRYIAIGELPSIKIGRTLRIPVSAVLEQVRSAKGE